jgi:protein-disulfide isomerase
MLPITFLARVNTARVRTALDFTTSLIMILAAISMMWFVFKASPASIAAPQRRQVAVPGQPVTLDGAIKFGNVKAAVAVIGFLDYQCNYCATFEREVMPAIEAKYVKSGKILFAIRHLPIDRIHPLARRAAEAAVCAAQQGKFVEMHKLLFEPQPTLDDVGITSRASQAGLNVGQLHSCIAKDGTRIVSADSAMAADLGIQGTPTFLIGRVDQDRRVKVDKTMFGTKSVEELSSVIDEVLTTAIRVP